MEIFGKYCLGMAEAQAASNSYTSSGCQWWKDYQSWINFNEANYQLCSVSRRRAERKDRPACRVPFLSDRPSNPHKEMQKKVLCGLFFPFVFLRGAVRKVSRLLSWAWVEGNLRRMGYRTGLCCFSPVLPYIYLWWPEKCMTTPHFEEGSGN